MNISTLVLHGFNIDYRHMSDGFILVHKPNGCMTDEDLSLIRSAVNAPDYMIWKSDYQTVTIG